MLQNGSLYKNLTKIFRTFTRIFKIINYELLQFANGGGEGVTEPDEESATAEVVVGAVAAYGVPLVVVGLPAF